MPKSGSSGIQRVVRAFGYTVKGLTAAFRYESAFRQELLLAAVLTPLAIWLGENAVEWVLLIGSMLLVLLVELLNSAVEAVVDRIGEEAHPLAGRAKDMGSAAVFIAFLILFLTWGLLLAF